MSRWVCRGILSFPRDSVWENNSSFSTGVLDVLDPDGDAGADDLLHCEGVDDFRTVVGELRRFLGGDNGDESCGGDFARVGSEDTINFFPDLEFVCVKADGAEGSAEVGVSTADLGEEGPGDGTKVSCEGVSIPASLGW